MHPTPAAVRPPARTADVVVSVVALVVAAAVVGMGVFAGVFLVAFLDDCRPGTCSAGGAIGSVVGGLAVAAVLGLGGLVVTVVRLSRRRTAWPFAVVTLVLCAVAVFAAGLGFFAAAGAL